jgi:O-antigen/teichoic acid export membrane protein
MVGATTIDAAPRARLRRVDRVTLGPGDRDRDRTHRVAVATVVGIAARGLTAVALLVVVPLASSHLTAAELGIWTLLVTAVALLGFVDLGLGSGLLTALSSAIGRDDRDRAVRLVSSAMAGMLAVGAGVGLVAVLVLPHVDWASVLGAEPGTATGVDAAVRVFVLLVLAAVPLGVGQRVHLAYQQGWAASAVTAAGSVLAIAMVAVAAATDAGLPWFVAAMVGGPVLAYGAETMWVFARSHPDLRPRRALVDRAELVALVRSGVHFFLLALAAAAAYQSDALIVAHRLGADEVARFGVAARLFLLAPTVLTAALLPLWPAYGEAVARGDGAWVRSTLRRSLVGCAALTVTASAVLLVCARPVLRVWAPSVADPPLGLLVALGIWAVVSACSTALGVYLNGVGRIRVQVVLALVMAVANVAASLALVGPLGAAGPVWASVGSQLLLVVLPLGFVLRGALREVPA